jgi:hypothetical protein
MEIVLNNWVEDVLKDLRSGRTPGYVKQYKDAAQRYLRVCRQHGPYQAAMLLCTEVAGLDNVEQSPKLLLHDHIFKFLGYEDGWLATILSEEPDPLKRLEQASHTTLFLMRVCDRL